MENRTLLKEREKHILIKESFNTEINCDKPTLAGSVSQRACVFCGSRVVLYPIADAVHLVHGPIGCAAYTWDIRGSLSSGPELHRLSFSTDLTENEVIHGGEKKLSAALDNLISTYRPKAAFVYSTCIVGIIGDDVDAICKKLSSRYGIPVISVDSVGFQGTKKDGYAAACNSLFKLIGTGSTANIPKHSINIMGEFNLAGEAWIIKEYYRKIGIHVVSTMTGDGRIEEICRAHGASLNIVQCSGSMMQLARLMEEKYGIPYIRVSYFGLEDVALSLYSVADFFEDNPVIKQNARQLVFEEITKQQKEMEFYKSKLKGKKAAIYVGGAFKAFSLIKSLRSLGISVVLAGSQTGNAEDYKTLRELCDPGTIIIDDANPAELSKFILQKKTDLFIGGVKERPMAMKLGIGFCDHNHERQIPLAGFEGNLNFAKEICSSLLSPVWKFTKSREGGAI
ncbi:MAG: nitrogenase iron-molybdenum cofactor biosynthesis protein NifE [Spirochaetes bacterium]|nr:nitrogenase iron-molybdenum cofactor biosynthesis protein NifE [Spirochaetota bacterium]MBN2771907.1 nitrogenase iron-molybdenum cofactor biosynthesis protein NifE [Spirochaetota bacterium]